MRRFLSCIFFAGAVLAFLPEAGIAQQIDCENIEVSAGLVPPELAAACAGQVPPSRPRLDPTDLAISPDGLQQQCSSIILNDPANPADFGAIDFRPACDFAGDDSTRLYCYTYDPPGTLSWVDPSTCTESEIGTGSNTQSATGMAWDDFTGTMYLSTTDITTSELFTVNLATGATSLVGSMGPDSPGNIAIAMIDGQMYGYDIVNDSLQSIDKTTGLATTIGPLGFDANFAQGMDFDESDGTCYIFAFNNGLFNAELRTCDVNTGATTQVGVIGNGFEAREWTGAGIPPSGTTYPIYCFDFDSFCDGIEITDVLPDKTVVGTWRNWDCVGGTAPLMGGYSGKDASPRLSWLAGDPDGELDVSSFNLNVDASTFDLFVHDTAFNLIQLHDDEPYTKTSGRCSFLPSKAGLPSSTGVNQQAADRHVRSGVHRSVLFIAGPRGQPLVCH